MNYICSALFATLELSDNLIRKIKKNDRKVILQLYKQSFSIMMSVVVRFHSNEDEQMTLVNNAFLKVIKNIEKCDPKKYGSWLKRITRNEVIDEFRRNKNYRELFAFDSEDKTTDPSVSAEVNQQHDAEALQSMINNLPKATKVVFNLMAIDGLSNKEIAEELDVSYETVKWHVKTARKKLRKQLEQPKNCSKVS